MQRKISRCRASNGLRQWSAAESRSNLYSTEACDGMYGCNCVVMIARLHCLALYVRRKGPDAISRLNLPTRCRLVGSNPKPCPSPLCQLFFQPGGGGGLEPNGGIENPQVTDLRTQPYRRLLSFRSAFAQFCSILYG